MHAIHVTIQGDPIGKPRMTQADKWRRRPCVLEYRRWADKAREELVSVARKFGVEIGADNKLPKGIYDVSWIAYIGMAESWPKKKRALLAGKPHFGKPDRDNIDKALLDSLFTDDRGVCTGTLNKFWDDGKGPRLEVTILKLMGEMP